MSTNNSVVPHFVVKVDYALQLRLHKAWATKVEFRSSNGSLKFENPQLYTSL